MDALWLFAQVFAVTLGIGLGIAALFAVLMLIARSGLRNEKPDDDGGKHAINWGKDR